MTWTWGGAAAGSTKIAEPCISRNCCLLIKEAIWIQTCKGNLHPAKPYSKFTSAQFKSCLGYTTRSTVFNLTHRWKHKVKFSMLSLWTVGFSKHTHTNFNDWPLVVNGQHYDVQIINRKAGMKWETFITAATIRWSSLSIWDHKSYNIHKGFISYFTS